MAKAKKGFAIPKEAAPSAGRKKGAAKSAKSMKGKKKC